MWRARPPHATGLVVRVSLNGPKTTYARYLIPEAEPLSPHEARDVSPADLQRRRAGTTIHEWLAATEGDPTNAFGEVAEALAAYALRHRTWWHARTPVELALLQLRSEGVFEEPGRAPALLAIWGPTGRRETARALAACNRSLNPDRAHEIERDLPI